jgi:hypothetical protein
MVKLSTMWLYTQSRSPWPGGGMPRDLRQPCLCVPSAGCVVDPAAGTGTAAAVVATAASVLACRTPITVRAPLLPKRRRARDDCGRRGFILVEIGGPPAGCLVRRCSWFDRKVAPQTIGRGPEVRRGSDWRRQGGNVVLLACPQSPEYFLEASQNQLAVPTRWKLWVRHSHFQNILSDFIDLGTTHVTLPRDLDDTRRSIFAQGHEESIYLYTQSYFAQYNPTAPPRSRK